MKNPVFTGAGVAIITPMYEDGSINFDELGRIVEDQIAHGTDAIVICGTTGECSTMTDEEQLATIKYTVDVVNHRVPVIAGAGSNDTDHGCALAAKSAECGADALLMVTPYYNKTSQAGLVAHFTAMAEAGGIPVIVYNVPSRTGLNIAPETALELSKHPLMKDFGVSKALVCTYQAISGAGKTFDRMPEIVDNVIPYIGGEEEKSEREPLKLWGHIEGDHIVNAEKPTITAQCFRVPVSDGHTAAVFVSFDKKPTKEQILEAWANFRGPAQELDLPSAPKQFLHYFTEPDRPQPKLDRNTENGMAVCIGRLREDTLFDYKFACMSHNTLRGAAGGGVLLAELLAAKGYFD